MGRQEMQHFAERLAMRRSELGVEAATVRRWRQRQRRDRLPGRAAEANQRLLMEGSAQRNLTRPFAIYIPRLQLSGRQSQSSDIQTKEQDGSAESQTVGSHQPLTARLSTLLFSGEGHDVTFTVGESTHKQDFKAHKAIMAVASDVFQAMFYGQMQEVSPICVPDIAPDAFKGLLEYIYTDMTELTFTLACKVLYAAKKYIVTGLENYCRAYLLSSLRVSTVCEIHDLVLGMEGEEILLSKCRMFLCQNAEGVLRSDNFCEVEQRTVQYIVQKDTLAIGSETSLLYGLRIWADRQCNDKGKAASGANMRKIVSFALPHIRFLTLSPQEFVSTKFLADILTDQEYAVILANLVTRDSRTYPEGFSKSTNTRSGALGLKKNSASGSFTQHVSFNW